MKRGEENVTDPVRNASKPIICIFSVKNQLKIKSRLVAGDQLESCCCKYPGKTGYDGLDPGY